MFNLEMAMKNKVKMRVFRITVLQRKKKAVFKRPFFWMGLFDYCSSPAITAGASVITGLAPMAGSSHAVIFGRS